MAGVTHFVAIVHLLAPIIQAVVACLTSTVSHSFHQPLLFLLLIIHNHYSFALYYCILYIALSVNGFVFTHVSCIIP